MLFNTAAALLSLAALVSSGMYHQMTQPRIMLTSRSTPP